MGSKLGAGVAAVVVAIPLLIGAGIVGIVSTFTASSASSTSLTCTPTGAVPGLTAEQMSNAATIVAVGQRMGVPEQGWVVAIAAAMQESGLRNLGYGDRDSLGLFQQRPSQGWGSPAQIMNPTYAASQFYQHLLAVPGWQHMSLTKAAQAVQRSAFPDSYAKHEQRAQIIVAATQGVSCNTTKADAVIGTGTAITFRPPPT
ncbi:hypothetical protein Atai01_42320 [Amycolatopsis taiwanensis]|uniref:Peptidase M23 n=1 Tax=Amycolatopsis taiwanensis TaxID=342230 RepID=A0A9W6VDR0_9PSEU|nr:hypothetical protein Atai01_42320 [Amycolatopsis taiwanensis]